MNNMQQLELIASLCQAFGPSGNEQNIRDIITGYISSYVDDIQTDALGNLLALKKATVQGEGKKIMLAAHMDEIGLIASFIDDKGFIRFGTVGGIYPMFAVGQHIVFENGTPGVVWYEEKHGDVKDTKIEKMFIDIGASSKEEAMQQVQVGDMAVFCGETVENNGRVISKAMDNRVGCAVLIQLIRSMPESANDVWFVFTAQEEVGLRGARTAAYGIVPDLAVAIDVCDAGDMPECNHMDVYLGKGATVKIMDRSVVSHPAVKNRLMERAEAAGLAYQLEVMEYGGTDAGSIQYSAGGVPSGGVSIPTRFIHSPAEMVDLRDVVSAVDLLREFVK